MRILFIFPRPNAYDSKSVRELPSGGTEKAVVFLGEAFQKLGHEVSWLTTLEGLVHPHPTPDVVITQHAEFLEQYPNSLKIFWSHHFSDQPLTQQQAPFVRCFADKVVTLSHSHASDLQTLLKLDSVTIGHGVWPGEVAQGEKDPNRYIYASTPFRGLAHIPEIFRQIKGDNPKASIAICSSMGTYGEAEKDSEYKALFDCLEAIPGVELKGALNQEQLYSEYAKAGTFLYPNSWPETECLALTEAIAHGCNPIVTNIGALPEKVNPTYRLDEITAACLEDIQVNCFEPKTWLEVAQQWEAEVLY